MGALQRACVFGGALIALALPSSALGQTPTAPDGRRGLGAETKLSDLLSVVRGGRDGDQAFMAELSGLTTDLRLLAVGTAERYRARGYFALIDGQGVSGLEPLWREFTRLAADPFPTLIRGGAQARALAGMLVDARFRVRGVALEPFSVEVGELEHGLAVLRGANAGYVQLTQAEAGAIARRIDLSASLLRAMRNDLIGLRPTPADARAEQECDARAQRLLELAGASEGENVRRAAVARECEPAAQLQALMERALFTTLLRESVAAALDWRARIFEESAPLRAEALQFLPDTEQGRNAPDEIKALAKHERMRGAGYAATRGLALDPLDEELVWVAAHAADFLYGIVESRPWYDRYLALHGIRAHEHKSYAARALTKREAEALDAIQRSEVPQPGRPRGQ